MGRRLQVGEDVQWRNNTVLMMGTIESISPPFMSIRISHRLTWAVKRINGRWLAFRTEGKYRKGFRSRLKRLIGSNAT